MVDIRVDDLSPIVVTLIWTALLWLVTLLWIRAYGAAATMTKGVAKKTTSLGPVCRPRISDVREALAAPVTGVRPFPRLTPRKQ